MYDLIIIGGGPAGCAGAVYSARKQLKTLLITDAFAGQSHVSEKIFNWIGTSEISGEELSKSLEKHVRYYEGDVLKIITGHRVTSLVQNKDTKLFSIKTSKDEHFETKTVLITSGSARRKLDIAGAQKFENKGVVYCASCDGPLFSGQDVAVIGGGNAGFETAAQLLAYTKSVTLIHRSADFRADEITVKKVLAREDMKALTNTEPIEIYGERFVKSLKVKDKVANIEILLNVTGIFVEIGQIPNVDFTGKLISQDDFGRYKVDPLRLRTKVSGIWAAGDVTNGLFHQNNIAAGDAVKAVEDIYLYLHTEA